MAKTRSAKKKPRRPKSRRGTPKPTATIPDFYQVLGVPVDASLEAIERVYHQRIREHPPETDPDGFESVSQAYDVLSRADRRRQYNLALKYGTTLERALEEGHRLYASGNLRLAHGQAKLALALDPHHVQALLLAAHSTHAPQMAWNFVARAVQNAPTDQAKADVVTHWAGWVDNPWQSLERLDQAEDALGIAPRYLAPARFGCFQAMGEEKRAAQCFSRLVNGRRKVRRIDVEVYRDWLQALLDEFGPDDSRIDQLMQRVKRHLQKGVAEDLHDIIARIRQTSSYHEHGGSLPAAYLWSRFTLLFTPQDRGLKRKMWELRTWNRAFDEVLDFYYDEAIPRTVRQIAWDAFLQRFSQLRQLKQVPRSPFSLGLPNRSIPPDQLETYVREAYPSIITAIPAVGDAIDAASRYEPKKRNPK